MRIRVAAIGLLLLLGPALGQTLTKDGFINPGSGDPVWHEDRWMLINDGSFEDGQCDLGSEWTCWSTTDCQWIIDAFDIWGYPAEDGVYVAWLGGFCDGMGNSNSYCQELFFYCYYLDFYWMSYVSSECGTLRVSVDGYTRFEHVFTAEDHNYGSWDKASAVWGWLDTSAWFGWYGELCFEWTACGEDTDGDGFPDTQNDSVIIDYVYGANCDSPADVSSFSVVKALY